MKDRAWLELDRSALRHNVEVLKSRLPMGCALMAVVKGNAYGHGLAATAAELCKLGVHDFCVATAEEGAALRRQGARGTILVLGYTNPSQFLLLEAADLTQTVVDADYAAALNAYGCPLRLHIKIDTGMHRLGISWDETDTLLRILACQNLRVEGLFTHLCADDSDEPEAVAFTKTQLNRFYQTACNLRAAGYPLPALHIQSSCGVFRHPQPVCRYARVGVALYGMLSTREDTARWAPELRPVLSARARVAAVHTLRSGEHAGYGLQFTARRETKLAVVAMGYADGVPRALSRGRGELLLHGRRCPIAGMVCMDQLLLDVTDVPRARQGDVATFIGADGGETVTACQAAERSGTIANEILSGLGTRFQRIWI